MSRSRNSRIAMLCIFDVLFTLLLSFAAAGPLLDPAVRVRSPQGVSPYDVARAVRREIDVVANSTTKFDVKGSTSLDRSWNDAVLLKFGDDQTAIENTKSNLGFSESVEVKCTQCYVKGTATGELSIGHVNASRIITQSFHGLENNFENLVDAVEDYIEDFADDLYHDITHDGFDWSDYDFPTFNYTLNMDVPAIPEANLRFSFDGLELYMQMDTILSLGSTYTLNLYTSDTPLGLGISDSLNLGIIFTVDLILDVEGTIDISSGFHIKVDDGLAIDIALFGDEASGITFNGGQFEFLPVTVESAGIIFKAILRVGAHAGFDLNTPDSGFPEVKVGLVTLDPDYGVGVGVDVVVFADVAEFVTSVKYNAHHADCELGIEQAYTFALGAGAGATLSLGTNIWGPTPTARLPIFYTTLASACAIKASPTPTAMPANISSSPVHKRAAMTTATISTDVTYTGVKCISTGMVNCPASLQTTVKTSSSTTFTTVVPSGTDEDAITSAAYQQAVATTVAFGKNAMKLPTSSGKPVSYTPPPPPPKPTATGKNVTSSFIGDIEHDGHTRVVIGLSIGLATSALISLGLAAFIAQGRRKRYASVLAHEPMMTVDEPYEPFAGQALSPQRPGKAVTQVSEARRYSDGS